MWLSEVAMIVTHLSRIMCVKEKQKYSRNFIITFAKFCSYAHYIYYFFYFLSSKQLGLWKLQLSKSHRNTIQLQRHATFVLSHDHQPGEKCSWLYYYFTMYDKSTVTTWSLHGHYMVTTWSLQCNYRVNTWPYGYNMVISWDHGL